MLKFLKGKKRSRNTLLIVFVGLLTFSLIGLFSVVITGGASGLFHGSGGDDAAVAKVGNLEVTAKELKTALSRFAQQVAQGQGKSGGEDLRTTYGIYGQQVLDDLMRSKLAQYEADRLNLGASDSEVQARIRQIFSPWQNYESYRLRLQQGGFTPLEFEDLQRAAIAEQHLRSYVTAAAQVSDAEIEDDYRRSNTQYSIRWASITPDQLRDKVVINDSEMRAYFDSHKDDFKITSEQRRARYVFIDKSKSGETIQLSEDELKRTFNPENYVTQVRVSEIVLNVPQEPKPVKGAEDKSSSTQPEEKTPSAEQQIRDKAQDLVKRAKGEEGKATGEDFAQLARANSEDARSKSNGGDLGWINKNDKQDADDPLSRVFTMKKDEVSQPIKKGDKYYILKVTDRKLPTLAERRDQILKDLRTEKSYSKAVDIANDAQTLFKESKDANAVVAQINKKYGAQVASAVETPFFAQGDKLPDLGMAPDFESAIFRLQDLNDVTEQTFTEKGFAIGQYLESRGPHDPTFDEVKSKVEERFRNDKSKELADQRAAQIAKANSPDELKKIADSLGVRVEERAGLPATDSFGPLVSDTDRAPVYKLNPGEVTHQPITSETGDNRVVVALVARKDADMGDAFKKERRAIEQRLLDARREIYFQTYLSETERIMKQSGKIKVYDEVISNMIESGAPSPSGMPQRKPTRRGPRGR